MEYEFSTPLRELPKFLSTISIVSDDIAAIVQKLKFAERKSPSRYDPAREHFCRVLQGDFSFDQGINQAKKISDSVQRTCAVDVLRASEKFLRGQPCAPVRPFSAMHILLPNEMSLNISPVLLRDFDQPRLMILYFWRTPLTARQLSAVGAVLKKALLQNQPRFAGCDLDFVSVSLSDGGTQRRFQLYSWSKLKALEDGELDRFWKLFCEAWSKYRSAEPRRFKRRREPSML